MSGYKEKLSAVVITYNEAYHIEKCLTSLLEVADEIVVVDSYSNDKTADICQNFRVRFYQRLYSGQIEQKQYALSLTKFDHVIALDGDEVLSQELVNSILTEKKNGFKANGYSFNRHSFYCGKWINHGDWYPDWKFRLWHKKKAYWGGLNPHDKVTLHDGKAKKLDGNLLHFTFESLAEHETQTHNYAIIAAKSYFNEGKTNGIWSMYLSPLFYFLKNYCFKGGFLDGRLGWQITVESMKGKWLKYKYLRQLNSGKPIP